MQKRFKRALVIWMLCIVMLIDALPAFALEDVAVRTVRVGYYHIEGYHVMDESGSRSGYGYEVLQAMKLYTNWSYEYVGYDLGWADMQQMLLDGELDMVISAVKTPERAEIYDFSDLPVSQSGACLMVKAGESPYIAGQYENYDGMRIGFIEGASQIAKTEAFAAEKGFQYTPVYYKTSDELESAILSGRDVDAIVTSNMRIIAGTRRLELFAMQDVYAMVQKGNAKLLDEINYALMQISLYNPGLYDSLYSKYYPSDAGDAVFFTPEESAFIASCKASGKPLRVSLTPDMSPYAYFEGDEPAGILYDIAMEILRRAGLSVSVVVAKTEREYQALLKDRTVDLFLATPFDYNAADASGYTLTNPYYTADVSRVTQKNAAAETHTVAVVQGGAIDTDFLPTVLRDERVLRFGSVKECTDAVLKGVCDAAYLYTATAQEAVYGDETNRLTSVVMPRFSVGFSIGVRANIDARLASILEKATASLSDDDVAKIELRHTDNLKQRMTLVGMLYNNPFLTVASVALLLILIFAGVMLAFTLRQRTLEREKNAEMQA